MLSTDGCSNEWVPTMEIPAQIDDGLDCPDEDYTTYKSGGGELPCDGRNVDGVVGQTVAPPVETDCQMRSNCGSSFGKHFLVQSLYLRKVVMHLGV